MQFSEVIMARKHVAGQCDNHKNLARLDYFRTVNPAVAEKLKGILEEHKAKEKGK